MKHLFLSCAIIVGSAGAAMADMSVSLLAPWDGKSIPDGQQCTLHGGNGATPPMKVSGLPSGTVAILVEYDDASYEPLSKDGGHGSLIYPAKGDSADLPSVPALSDQLPHGVTVHKPARGTGKYASKGYLPPCSGGNGNTYTATLKAIGDDGKMIEETTVTMGKY